MSDGSLPSQGGGADNYVCHHGSVLVSCTRHPRYSFVKEKIALAPNNASAWNYLRGVLDHARMPYSTQAAFAELYVVDAVKAGTDDDVIDLDNPTPSQGAELPCPAALEFMADIHEAKGKEGVAEAVRVSHFLTRRLTLLPYSPMPLLTVVEFARTHTRHYSEKVRIHKAAHRPSIKLVTRTGTGNIAFETQMRPLVQLKASKDLRRGVRVVLYSLYDVKAIKFFPGPPWKESNRPSHEWLILFTHCPRFRVIIILRPTIIVQYCLAEFTQLG